MLWLPGIPSLKGDELSAGPQTIWFCNGNAEQHTGKHQQWLKMAVQGLDLGWEHLKMDSSARSGSDLPRSALDVVPAMPAQ